MIIMMVMIIVIVTMIILMRMGIMISYRIILIKRMKHTYLCAYAVAANELVLTESLSYLPSIPGPAISDVFHCNHFA